MLRQAAKRRDRNRYYGKTTRNAIRDLKEIKDVKEAAKQLPEVISMIDKLAKKGIIHKNKASNLKSKLARRTKATAPQQRKLNNIKKYFNENPHFREVFYFRTFHYFSFIRFAKPLPKNNVPKTIVTLRYPTQL